MAGFSSTLALVGTGMQVYGQYKAGQDAADAAEYNAQVYQSQARNIDIKKDVTAIQYDRAIKRLAGQTVVGVAAQGRDLSGSALHVLTDNLEQAEFDKAIEIFNIETDKTRALSSAAEYRVTAAREKRSGITQSIGTLLTQGNAWYQQYGGFGKVS